MKAAQITAYGGPEVIEIVDLPTPEPGAGEVLVRAAAIGVGKPDFLLRSGIYRWKPPLPTILGNEMSGHIEALGPGVSGLQEGQPVMVFGTGGGRYAEYNAVPTSLVTPLPDSVDLDAAVAIPNYIIAWALLFEAARGIDAKTVYVNGAAGGMGTAIIDLCRSRGIDIIGGASTAEKCAFIADYGATQVINYTDQDLVARATELTGGRGVDLAFDQLIGPRFVDTLDMLAPLGMAVSYNALAGLPEDELFAGMRARAGKSLAVRCFSWHAFDDAPEKARRITDAVVGEFAAGKFKPAIHDRLPLSDVRRAHEMLDAREIMGKLVLKP
ncbi:MAG: zinc-binding dehydrogenase [Alphaproteobacteria bacterium]|nr:zinc-binding dehydrogenase [Alphaproteobacteria bacterium]